MVRVQKSRIQKTLETICELETRERDGIWTVLVGQAERVLEEWGEQKRRAEAEGKKRKTEAKVKELELELEGEQAPEIGVLHE